MEEPTSWQNLSPPAVSYNMRTKLLITGYLVKNFFFSATYLLAHSSSLWVEYTALWRDLWDRF